jgi:glutathione synthase/RimK-type ligase-like ATP-grasp enzyme
MPNAVVVFAKEDDPHALKVAGILRDQYGKEVFIFDTSSFPGAVLLTGRFDTSAPQHCWLENSTQRICLSEVGAFWWRRPQPMAIDAQILDANAREFAFQECVSALFGILECCEGLWVNNIQSDVAAEYKPFQLKVAREHGLTIPETLITNDTAQLMQFWHRHQSQIIYKAFNQRALNWRPTRLLREQDLAFLHNLRHAPVIFQSVVPGIRDIRVTVVGDDLFASEFDIERMEEVDHRMCLNEIPCRPHRLPHEIEGRVRSFMSALTLEYGGVDFRLTPDGQYVFFEVNTAGEFLYLESRTDQPISHAMAAHLARGKSARAGSRAKELSAS